MSDSDRDPLFFAPGKTPEQEESQGPIIIEPERQEKALLRLIVLAALAVLAVLLLLKGDALKRAWMERSVANAPSAPGQLTPAETERILRLTVQAQAETLLRMDIRGTAGASPLLNSRLEVWQHRLRPDQRLMGLVNEAMNSDDSMQIRTDGVEMLLAAYGVDKTPASVENFIQKSEPGQQYRTWALWILAALGSRGVEPGRVHETLMSALHDPNEDVRRWAAESLALSGDDGAVPALLEALRSDPSHLVRNRAAAGIAVNGMLTEQQRMSAVPELLKDLDDPALDAPTRADIYHVFRDLSHRSLPDDAAQWRAWYASTQRPAPSQTAAH
jgi:hypothetical protein